jgi:hypothetical protein
MKSGNADSATGRSRARAARRMLTVTAQFDFFRCFLAVLTAILAVFTAIRDDAQTGRMLSGGSHDMR